MRPSQQRETPHLPTFHASHGRRRIDRLHTIAALVLIVFPSFPPTSRTCVMSQEKEKTTRLAGKVKVPAEAPCLQEWYIGRTATVAATCDRLGVGSTVDQNRTAEIRMVGLAGPSGAGKSTVASMVVARKDVRACFRKGVLWLAVGEGAKDRLPALMHRLAHMVHDAVLGKHGRPPGMRDIGVEPDDGASYVRQMMGQFSRHLLIVADDVWEAEVLEELRNTGAAVLYTTRSDTTLDNKLLRLDRIEKDEAETVLRRAARLKDRESLPDEAYEVMERCGYVAMDLAFVCRWGAVRGRIDSEAWQGILDRISEVQKSGNRAAALSWRTATIRAGRDELARETERNKTLFLSLSVLPKGFAFTSEDAAALTYGEDYSAADLEAVSSFMATLERKSIIVRQVGGLSRVHDMHSDFLRGLITDFPVERDGALERWRKRVSTAEALFAWSLEALVDIWRSVADLSGRVVARPYDTVLDAMDPSDCELPKYLRRVAYFHWLAGDRGAACAKWAKLLAIEDKTQLVVKYPSLEFTLFNLGLHEERSGRIEEAENWFQRTLSIEEERLGADHPNVAHTLHRLAQCAAFAGRVDDSEWLHWRALGIRETKLHANHPDIATTLHGLGVSVFRAGRTEEAKQLLGRALAICGEKPGNDRTAGYILYDLGRCACVAGDMEEAERMYRQALAIQEERAVETSRSAMADTLYALGGYSFETGRVEEAEGLYRRALLIRENSLRDDHPVMARTIYGLGKCTFELGRAEEADELYRQALGIAQKNLGGDHQAVADILHSLGVCALELERTDEAAGFLKRALSIYEGNLGLSHSKVAHTAYDLGRCAFWAGRAQEEEGYYRRALDIEERTLGPDHPEVATILHALGGCASKAGKMEEAERLYRRALAIREDCLDEDDRDVADTLHAVGKCLLMEGQTDEAEALYRRALAIQEKTLPADHPDVVDMKLGLEMCKGFPANSTAKSMARMWVP